MRHRTATHRASFLLLALFVIACETRVETSPGADSTAAADSAAGLADSLGDIPGGGTATPVDDSVSTPPADTTRTRRDTTNAADSIALLVRRSDSVRVWVRAVRDSLQYQIDTRALPKTQTVTSITIESSVKDSAGRSKGTIASELTDLAGGAIHLRSAAHRFGNASVAQPATYRYEVRGAGLQTPRTLTGRKSLTTTPPQKWPVVRTVTPPAKTPPVSRRQSIDPLKVPAPTHTVPDSARAGRRR